MIAILVDSLTAALFKRIRSDRSSANAISISDVLSESPTQAY